MNISYASKRSTHCIFILIAIMALTACQFVGMRKTEVQSATQTQVETSGSKSAGDDSATPAETTVAATASSLPQNQFVHIVPSVISGARLLSTTHTYLDISLLGKDDNGNIHKDDFTIERIRMGDLRQQSTIAFGSLTTRVLSDLTKSEIAGKITQSGSFRINQDAYWMTQFADDALQRCVKLDTPGAYDPFQNRMTPSETLLTVIQKTLYGTLVKEEIVYGVPSKHYMIDASASNNAALASDDYFVRDRAKDLQLRRADVYVAIDGNYLVSLNAQFEGKFNEFGFEGTTELKFHMDWKETSEAVILPQACLSLSQQQSSSPTDSTIQLLKHTPYIGMVEQGFLHSAITFTLDGTRGDGRAATGDVFVAQYEDQRKQVQVATISGNQLAFFMQIPDEYNAVIKRVTVYKVGQQYYLHTEGQQTQNTHCIIAKDQDAISVMTLMNPSFLVDLYTGRGALYGQYQNTEVVNGADALHYHLDVATMNSRNVKGSTSKTGKADLVQGDAYIVRKRVSVADMIRGLRPIGQDLIYLARLTAEYDGRAANMDFTGRYKIEFDQSIPQGMPPIQLPAICRNASSS